MQEHSSSLSVDGATSKTVVHEVISSHQDGHGHSNLEAAELNSGHWGDLPHFSARSLCKPFHILEGRKVLFPPENSNHIGTSAGFWYNARGKQKGLAIRSANMREGQRNELFCTGLHSVLEVSSLELLNQQSTCRGHTLFNIS
jgi:hypothetical protein